MAKVEGNKLHYTLSVFFVTISCREIMSRKQCDRVWIYHKRLEILNAVNIVTIEQIDTTGLSIYFTFHLINLHKMRYLSLLFID